MSYIVFEGADGTGKTTLAATLAQHIKAKYVYEPLATDFVTTMIRKFCFNPDYAKVVTPNAREYLLMASRVISMNVVADLIIQNKTVVSDRSFLSGMVYSLVCSDWRFENWWKISGESLSILPDVVVLVTSKQKNNKTLEENGDIYDIKGKEFHDLIENTFPRAIDFVKEKEPNRIKFLTFENDFTKTKEENFERLKVFLQENNVIGG